MYRYCSVPHCKSWGKKNPELTFHLFPEAGKNKVHIDTKFGTKNLLDSQKAWILKLRIGKPVTKFMRVCSLHFTQDDYFHRGDNSKRKILKKTAVPSQKLPLQVDACEAGPSSRTDRYNKRSVIKDTINNPGDNLCECTVEEQFQHTEEDRAAAESLIQLLQSQPNYTGPKKFMDFQAQVNTPKVSTLCDLLTSDAALNSFTGLYNFQLLDALVEAVGKVYNDFRVHRLNIRERVVLVLTKLKCDLSYITLSILFGISQEVCRTYISDMLPILSQVLKSTIRFPDSTENKRNMPKCFEAFQDVRVVLDCTEMCVQKPKCLCCRIRFYSQYKSNITVKYMTGVSPGGIITFVSEPYGGRASDKAIFEQSNLITKLESSVDAIMVDKGFMIDDICERFKIKLIRPPFLRKKKQLSTEEAVFNSKIAAARVHIERSNQRIKIFKILNGKLHWSLLPKIKDIFLIICGITNLSSPILADDKFLCS